MPTKVTYPNLWLDDIKINKGNLIVMPSLHAVFNDIKPGYCLATENIPEVENTCSEATNEAYK